MGLEIFQLHNKLLDQMPMNKIQMQETNTRLFIGFGAIFFYLVIGAIVMVQIEGPTEGVLFEEYSNVRIQYEETLMHKGMTYDEIDEMFAFVRYMAEIGVWKEKNETSDRVWGFGRAFFFSGTLLTTIGYGSMSPKTPHGKLFVIVYCIIGIPLTLALLSALAHRLKFPSVWLRKQLNVHLGHLFHAIHLQDWTFIDAIFFCFVSLSTIGLGDFTPGDEPGQPARGFYKFLVTCYLLAGLSCMMLFLATLYDIPQLNLTRFFVTKSDNLEGDETEKKPIHMANGGPKYSVYSDIGVTESPVAPFTAINGYYQ
ncbi:hypothetical protein FO519_002462 [Halicephalobus sp. NKZ332]|nr:hypothetical protein FO519_002462 [Halicephalobus sp. NKZ332]